MKILVYSLRFTVYGSKKAHLTFAFLLVTFYLCLAQPVSSPDVKCVSVAANGDVTLTWITPADPGGNFVDYKIFSSLTPAGPYGLSGTVNTYTQTTFTDVGANAHTQRVYFLVQTEYNPGPVLSSPVDTFSTIHLLLTNSTSQGILNWNAIASPIISTSYGWYRIYREYPGGSGNWTLRDSTQNLTYTDIIDICNDTLAYRIEIADSSGCISVSNAVGGKFDDNTPPALAQIDTVSVNAAGLATISWYPSPSPDADSVVIYSGCGPWIEIATVPVPQTFYTYPLSNAVNISECYRVAFLDSCGNLSAQVTEHKTIYLSATFDVCAATASLTWNKYINMNSPVIQYQILKSVNAGPFTLLAANAAGDTTYSDTGLAPENSYCYIIRATNGTKTSSSNKACFSGNVSQPPEFIYNRFTTVLSDKSIQITAHVDTGGKSVRSYNLLRATGASGNFSVIKNLPLTSGTTLSFTDNSVMASANSYSYNWQALDSCARAILTSNPGTSMLLTVSISANLDITLSWNDYGDWLGNTDHYDIYRAVDGVWNPAPIATYLYTGSGGTYVDDVAPYLSSKGIFSYKVVALEGIGDTFGFKDSSASNIAIVYEYPKFYVPNCFTPNGDGINDLFIPVIGFIEPGEYTFTIFDNTGTPVMRATNPDQGWDGKKNGHNCPEGVYMYLINCKSSKGDDSKITGTVSLIR